MPLRNMPLGTLVHCVELKPGKGAQIAAVLERQRNWSLKKERMLLFVYVLVKCAKSIRL
jgi:hypothetical protein